MQFFCVTSAHSFWRIRSLTGFRKITISPSMFASVAMPDRITALRTASTENQVSRFELFHHCVAIRRHPVRDARDLRSAAPRAFDRFFGHETPRFEMRSFYMEFAFIIHDNTPPNKRNGMTNEPIFRRNAGSKIFKRTQ